MFPNIKVVSFNFSLRIFYGLADQIVLDGLPFLHTHPVHYPRNALTAEYAEKVVFQGDPFGTLACGPKRSGAPFAEAERELIKGLAAQTALALHNAGAIEALREAQEALLRILKAASRYRARGKFKTFLFTVVLNLVRETGRQKKRRSEVSFEEIEDRNPSAGSARGTIPQPDEPLHRNQVWERVLEALDQLPAEQRSVFVLTCFLLNLGWKPEDVKAMLIEWNSKNQEPLKEPQLLYTLRDQMRRGKPLMCPNCNADNYYKSYGVCTPDRLCQNIKNPPSPEEP